MRILLSSLTFASQYIARAGSHSEVDTTKDSYISRICDRLRKRVDNELCSLLRRSLYLPNRDEDSTQNQLMDVADFSSMIPEAQTAIPRSDSHNAKLESTNPASLTPCHDLNGMSPIFLSSPCLRVKKAPDLVGIFRRLCSLSLLSLRCVTLSSLWP